MIVLNAFTERSSTEARKFPAAPALRGISISNSAHAQEPDKGTDSHYKVDTAQFLHTSLNCSLDSIEVSNIDIPDAQDLTSRSRR